MTGDTGRSGRVAGIRGAIDVESDTPAAMSAAVRQLVLEISGRNSLTPEQIISAQFTVTPDLRSIFPAAAAREAGWGAVPMLCATAIDVPGALPLCVRILVLADFDEERRAEHVYLGKAAALRPDLRSNGD